MRAASVVAIVALVVGVTVPGVHARPTEAPRRPASPSAPPRSSGVFTIGGTPHPYVIEGTGPTCIVTGLAPFFPPQFSDRLKQRIRFVYVDFKNSWNAESPGNVEKITMDYLVDEVDQVRRALGLDKVCVFGHSATGFIAVEYALRHPDRVSHSILVAVEPYFTREYQKIHDAFWETDASADRKAVKRRLDERLPNETLASLSPRDAFAMRYVRNGPKYFYDASYDFAWLWLGRQFSAELIARYVTTIAANWDPRPRLARNTVPTFLALGRYDYNVPPVTWDNSLRSTPRLTTHVFDRSGHFPMLEEPALFDDVLIRWLDAQRAEGGRATTRSAPSLAPRRR